MTEQFNISLIGTGLMGRGIGRSLLRNGFSLTVYDTNPEAIVELKELGAGVAETLVDAAAKPFVITCLPNVAAIESVYEILIPNANENTVLIDCSTSDPALTKRLGRRAAKRDVHMIAAPMLMGPAAAWEGSLRLIVGGEAGVIAAVKPLFDAIAEDVVMAGDLEDAHAMKLINNSVVMGNHVVLCEAFTVASKAGLDLETLTRVLNGSRAASKKLDELSPRLINDDHTLHFALDTAYKDVRLFNSFACHLEVPVQAANAVRNVFQTASALGLGAENVSRIATVLARLANIAFPKKKVS